MKARYTFLLSLGLTILLTAILFVPISVKVAEPKPAVQAKAATISLVDRIAFEQADDAASLPEKEKPEETLVPVEQEPLSEEATSTSQTSKDEVPLSQQEAQAATEIAEQPSPTLINGVYYPIESVTSAPVFDRALLASRIVYPPLAKRQKKEGLVILRLFIAPSGLVEQIVVEEDPGYGLSEAASAAFASFKVSPALYNNEPVAVTLRYPVRFTLQ